MHNILPAEARNMKQLKVICVLISLSVLTEELKAFQKEIKIWSLFPFKPFLSLILSGPG